MSAIETTPALVRQVYATLEERLAVIRRRLGRPASPTPRRSSSVTWWIRRRRGARAGPTAIMELRGRTASPCRTPRRRWRMLQFMLLGSRRDGRPHDGALRPPDPGVRKSVAEDDLRIPRATPTARSTSSCGRLGPLRHRLLGRPAPASSTRWCSRSTPSPAA